MADANTCVICGKIITEDKQVCDDCQKFWNYYNAHPERFLQDFYGIKIGWLRKLILKISQKFPVRVDIDKNSKNKRR